MRSIAFVLLAACGGAPAAAPATPASASTLECGSATCAGGQLCIETEVGPATSAPQGQEMHTSHVCAARPETGSGYSCTTLDDRHQHCVALLPVVPHR